MAEWGDEWAGRVLLFRGEVKWGEVGRGLVGWRCVRAYFGPVVVVWLCRMWWGGMGRGVQHRGIDACMSVGVACACPAAHIEIMLSPHLSTILRLFHRTPKDIRGAIMLERVQMGRVDEEFSRCGRWLDCPAGSMDAL